MNRETEAQKLSKLPKDTRLVRTHPGFKATLGSEPPLLSTTLCWIPQPNPGPQGEGSHPQRIWQPQTWKVFPGSQYIGCFVWLADGSKESQNPLIPDIRGHLQSPNGCVITADYPGTVARLFKSIKYSLPKRAEFQGKTLIVCVGEGGGLPPQSVLREGGFGTLWSPIPPVCITSFAMTNSLTRSSLREEGFIWAYWSRGCSPLWHQKQVAVNTSVGCLLSPFPSVQDPSPYNCTAHN